MDVRNVRAHALPAIRVIGSDADLRSAIRSDLTADGYEVQEAATLRAAPGATAADGTVVVVCPDGTDASGLLALAALDREERSAWNTAYIFVLSGDIAPLTRAVKDLRTLRYVAIVARSCAQEALERQLALASRWLQIVPAPVITPPVELDQVATL